MPTPVAPLNIRQKVEASLQAWLLAVTNASGSSPLVPILANFPGNPLAFVVAQGGITTSQVPTIIKYPIVTLIAQSGNEEEEIEGIYRVTLAANVVSKAAEIVTPPATSQTLHAARVGMVEELLSFGYQNAMFGVVNYDKCAPGPDPRTVQGIRFYDIFLAESRGGGDGEHWIDELTYSVICALRDE